MKTPSPKHLFTPARMTAVWIAASTSILLLTGPAFAQQPPSSSPKSTGTAAGKNSGSPSSAGYVDKAHLEILRASEGLLKDQTTPHLNSADAETAQAAKELMALLGVKRQGPAPTPASLIGKWQVRSIQSSDLGVYAYPYFSCEILREGQKIAFSKNSGSQRRAGQIEPFEGNGLLFLGGSYYDDEEPRGYSLLPGYVAKPVGSGRRQDDDRNSVGQIFQLGKGHLLMIFASLDGRGEIYELKKR